mmetsp:Transcript_46149/g.72216  ORF Transcript_46149/g.72216 Transcript_46149/m.72216 type:complete len:125 (-) Transcript_46149:209-583(-)
MRLLDDAASLQKKREGDSSQADDKLEKRRQKLQELLKRAAEKTQRPSIPECLCCQITFDLMKDPVMTPSGQTYEREAVEAHLNQNGRWDPVTRQALQRYQLVPNKALKSVITDFLRDNPWAYGS